MITLTEFLYCSVLFSHLLSKNIVIETGLHRLIYSMIVCILGFLFMKRGSALYMATVSFVILVLETGRVPGNFDKLNKGARSI